MASNPWSRSLALVLAGWLGGPAWTLVGHPALFLNQSAAPVSLRCLEVEGTPRPAQCSELWAGDEAGPVRRMYPPDDAFRQGGGVLRVPAGQSAVLTMVFPGPAYGTEDLTDHYLLRTETAGGGCTLIYTAAVFREPDSDPVTGGVLEEHAAGSEPGPALLEHPSLGGILDMTTLVFRGLRGPQALPGAGAPELKSSGHGSQAPHTPCPGS